MALLGGAKAIFPDRSPTDMGFETGWDQLVKFVCAVFRCPAVVAGLAQSSTYAEWYAALKQFFTGTLIPHCSSTAAHWTLRIVRPAFGDPPAIDDQDQLLGRLGFLKDCGALTKGEARVASGFELFGDERDDEMAGEQAPGVDIAALGPDPSDDELDAMVDGILGETTGPDANRPDNPDGKGSLPERIAKSLNMNGDSVNRIAATLRAWEEGKHKRGQPENAGQFGSGGGGEKKKSRGKSSTLAERLKQKIKERLQAGGTAEKKTGGGQTDAGHFELDVPNMATAFAHRSLRATSPDEVLKLSDQVADRVRKAYAKEWKSILETVADRLGPDALDDPRINEVHDILRDGYRSALESLDEMTESLRRGAEGKMSQGSLRFENAIDDADALRKSQIETAEQVYNRLALLFSDRGESKTAKAAKSMVRSGLFADRETIAHDPAVILKAAQWEESKHRRGQPENAGQFGSSGGPSKKSSRAGGVKSAAPLVERLRKKLKERLAEKVKERAKPAGETTAEPPAPAKRSYRDEVTDSPAFKAWFGDSKVVDGDGKPLVVYHGTKADFAEFDPGKGGESSTDVAKEMSKIGVWFTPHAGIASAFADRAPGDSGNVTMPVYLKMENPFVWDWENQSARDISPGPRKGCLMRATEELKRRGHDGIIWHRIHDRGENSGEGHAQTQYVVFSPHQIKSATGNRGTFDPADPDTRKSFDPESFDGFLKAGHDVTGQPRDTIGRWTAAAGHMSGQHPSAGPMPPILPGMYDPSKQTDEMVAARERHTQWTGANVRHQIAERVEYLLTKPMRMTGVKQDAPEKVKVRRAAAALEETEDAATSLDLLTEAGWASHRDMIAGGHSEGGAAIESAKVEAAKRLAAAIENARQHLAGLSSEDREKGERRLARLSK